jgi:hypothetical protein
MFIMKENLNILHPAFASMKITLKSNVMEIPWFTLWVALDYQHLAS